MADPLSHHDDKFARESFTWRRMRPWQIWTMAAVVAGLLLGALIVLA